MLPLIDTCMLDQVVFSYNLPGLPFCLWSCFSSNRFFADVYVVISLRVTLCLTLVDVE